MESDENMSAYPFRVQPGEEIARGWSESRVYRHEPGWVLKITYRKSRNSKEQLAENKADYEFFKSRLGEYVPETQFLIGQDEKGRRVNIVRQKEIAGRTLLSFTDEEIKENIQLQRNLVVLFERIIKMWEEDGRIPDLVGPRKGGRSFLTKFTPGTHPEHTPNIIVEEGTSKPYLVDTSASVRFQSKDSPFPYLKLSEMIVANMRRFVSKYT
ncbi:hypothetical protein A3A76_02820 [Candidatus Woesebacteria bacterium RIFCSPLOWO2_01_FULL_39_23]|uniref:Protein kinase domain-containing protein n=1 Tax=Candidatus Woesebacteria bacterium RIFCSPHIGHO2_01_FULL_40_22 TaxID=1802499 RepID=A0A1F7YJF9_9BACT|nr:MAG: hypothetical protein A2141_01200 [Candidatus Woesebacteria bacterium RBG_16_40_11]OGM27407.1 MAG: hypothetical protein A2628_01225 [Candidatus Woesebacteria bacterium RIFCSPHIGHO2_01_FULL_40_22]OGM36171.1 MAG: hypothetical protein A3E41_01510 [Candidatus Woesebacteria bacterium RIFCSPHIGHO2_12_FULL_38_9]OGM62579.1 MAG: hypothetical protein A3A76_02820 [Candidatus Woesebacteria bacterium RIFCSPLOWO2_01_FULL_39_23]